MNGHQHQHRKRDRYGEREIEEKRRQRQDEDHEDGHHAQREPDIAAPEHGAEVGQPRQRQAVFLTLGRCYVTHAAGSAPSVAVARFKGVRRSWGAAGTQRGAALESKAAPERVQWKRLCLPGIMCLAYGHRRVNEGAAGATIGDRK